MHNSGKDGNGGHQRFQDYEDGGVGLRYRRDAGQWGTNKVGRYAG